MLVGWRRKLWAAGILARYGKPTLVLSFSGGLGDQLLLTIISRELRQRRKPRAWVSTFAPDLFLGNPDIQRIIGQDSNDDQWFVERFGGKSIRPNYAPHISEERRDIPPAKHLLAIMCEQAGLSGQVDLRPYLYLTRNEIKLGRICEQQIAIQSTGKSSKHFILNKEWFPERFQAVVDALKNQFNFVQVGSKNDFKLQGAHDMRGKLSIRGTAAVLANSVVFVGLVGFLMHLARAVECRAVIIYGGRELPSQSGYICNENLIGQTACSPCWRYDSCSSQRACMEQITVEHVVQAIRRVVNKNDKHLELERLTL